MPQSSFESSGHASSVALLELTKAYQELAAKSAPT